MPRSTRLAFASLVASLGAGGFASMLLSSAACSGSVDVSGAEDAAPAIDARAANDSGSASNDSGPPSGDAGSDATVRDSSAPPGDAEATDSSVDGGPIGDGDVGIDCATVLNRIFGGAFTPPAGWAGLDLSAGGAHDGGLDGGGLTIDQAGILACATSVEPLDLDGGAPTFPGSRTATFSDDAGGVATVSYNRDSRVIWEITVSGPATSSVSFHARAGGPYASGGPNGGPSVYVISLGPSDGGAGFVTKNGADFPADWNDVIDDAGTPHASAWVNEIYDGMMATYAPSVPAVADCRNSPFDAPTLPAPESACLTIPGEPGVLGIRPLRTYFQFNGATNQTQYMYQYWTGGWPSCATPNAALENASYMSIFPQFNYLSAVGPLWAGTMIAGMAAAEPVSNPAGLLVTEANTFLGCTGTSATAPDPGYAAEQWGNGEIEVEYKPDSGVAYKVIAKQGYRGVMDVIPLLDDGGFGSEYLIQPGSLTANGVPVTIPWGDADGGTLNALVTDISNAWLADYCGNFDNDCVQAGDCTIVPDDGNGHSTITFQASANTLQDCIADVHPLTLVFPKGSSVPSEIQATNPGGQ